jgi:hypothetical protein
MFQSLVARLYRLRLCNNHNPHILSQIVLVLSHNFFQTTPNTIASNRASQATRRDKADSKQARIRHNGCAKYQQFAGPGNTISFYVLEF